MTKRQKRLLAIAIVLGLVFILLATYFYVYKRTKKLSFRVTGSAQAAIAPPEFLFSFSGEGGNRLQRPVGITVADGTVYVTDSVRSRVFTFDENGELTGSFGESETVNPLYLAKNPKDGLIYVTDRRRYTILKFGTDGSYKGEFIPDLPKEQLPTFETGGVKWQPVAIAFADDGTMFVTEILKGHRLLVFSPAGQFVNSTGDAGSVSDPAQGPQVFQFPNGLFVDGKDVYVADSNNQRVKVYDLKGEYKRTIVTGGLPRGIVMLDKLTGDDGKSPKRFVETDTLSHYATIWTADGKQLLNFGEQGVLDGQFSYPGGVARGRRNRLFIADTSNGRVQAWGWPQQEAGIPAVNVKSTIPWLAIPLLALIPLLARRRRQFFATADFVKAVAASDQIRLLPDKKRRWITTPEDYEVLKDLVIDGVELGAVFEPVAHSDSDVRALIKKYDLDEDMAVRLATAEQAKVAGVEEEELRRLAKMMELDVVHAAGFIDRFGPRRRS